MIRVQVRPSASECDQVRVLRVLPSAASASASRVRVLTPKKVRVQILRVRVRLALAVRVREIMKVSGNKWTLSPHA